MAKILKPALFAREDTKTPLKFALASVVVNIVLSLILFVPFKHVGIAMATSLAGWLKCLLLARRLRANAFLVLDARCQRRLPRIFLAALAMGLVLWGLSAPRSPWFDAAFLQRVIGLTILVTVGLAVFALATVVTGGSSLQDMRALLGRRTKGAAARLTSPNTKATGCRDSCFTS